jgi:hypothetical protein
MWVNFIHISFRMSSLIIHNYLSSVNKFVLWNLKHRIDSNRNCHKTYLKYPLVTATTKLQQGF